MGDHAHWGLAGSTITVPGGTIAGKTFFKNENPGCVLGRAAAPSLSRGSCLSPQGWAWPCQQKVPVPGPLERSFNSHYVPSIRQCVLNSLYPSS